MMSKSKGYLGHLEELVLLAIVGLEGNAYGVTIRKSLEDAGRSLSYGALYTTLDRLEQKRYVTSWQGGATATRGGRAKRFFRVEPLGDQILKDAEAARSNLAPKLDPAAEY